MATYSLKAATKNTDIAALCALSLQLTNHLTGRPFEHNFAARIKSSRFLTILIISDYCRKRTAIKVGQIYRVQVANMAWDEMGESVL